jgi:hypothetical protein
MRSAKMILPLAAVALVAACAGSSTPSGQSADPTSSSSPTATKGAGQDALAGTWHFTLEGVHLTFGSGHFSGAKVTTSANTIVVTGNQARSKFTADDPYGDVTITCTSQACHASLLGFKPSGSGGYDLINYATLSPREPVGSGAQYCGAPAAPAAYVIDDFNGSAFSYVAGHSGNLGGGACYQVLWTVKATKVG